MGLVVDLERMVAGKEKGIQISYPREFHFLTNAI